MPGCGNWSRTGIRPENCTSEGGATRLGIYGVKLYEDAGDGFAIEIDHKQVDFRHDVGFTVPYWLASLFFAPLSARIAMRAFRHTPAGSCHCPKCGYNLTGNTSGVCPECGTPCTTCEPSNVGVEK